MERGDHMKVTKDDVEHVADLGVVRTAAAGEDHLNSDLVLQLGKMTVSL